ncbi:hypothetical protein [Streptomyces sp. NPDC001843]|uniref:hypothetical protein n=1 Tax=Streptomyces sp. NPDC001843 TaxID=3364617 RepID=UPI0036B05FAC
MKSTTVRRVTLSIAVVTALTGLAACGTENGSSGKAGGTSLSHVSPVAALRSAEKSTDKALSARVRSTTTIGNMMSMTANGTVAWGNGMRGDLTITYTGGKLVDAMRQAGSTSTEARYLPDAYYTKMSGKVAEQMGGKHWLRYGFDDLAKFSGGSGAYMKDQMQNTTPKQSVNMLLASGDVKKVGEEKVSGVRSTHYSGTVNVADLVGKNSNLSAGQLADVKKQLTQAGVTTETLDIWLNDQDLLVKAAVKADMATGPMTSTAYYTDYGVKVSVQKPPASDTRDVKDLMKSLGTPGSGNTASGSDTSSS